MTAALPVSSRGSHPPGRQPAAPAPSTTPNAAPMLQPLYMLVTAQLLHFWAAWEQASAQPPPISAARVVLPVRLNVLGAGVLQFRLVSAPFVRDTRFRLIYFVPADAATLRQCAAWASA